MRWLSESGHACHILTTARLHDRRLPTREERLKELGIPWSFDTPGKNRRPVIRYALDGIPVTLLQTRHNDESQPDAGETAQYNELMAQLLSDFAPDQVVACNSHPMVLEALGAARRRGVTTVFSLRALGYYDRRYFESVDHVFANSKFLSDMHLKEIGLISTPIESPIQWSEVIAPTESRAFLTFVNPIPHKGLMLFARLADMLGSKRPDIPILVVQSVSSAGSLNSLPVDFTRYPQIMASPPVKRPAEYFALTKVLLVPSVVEAFGRVAAEALINAIPAIVSDRGGLPDTVGGDFDVGGGGKVLPLPGWMARDTLELPSEAEVRPWFDAVCSVWDDPDLYERISRQGARIAQSRYSEKVSRERHLNYLTSLKPGGTVFS